MYFLFKIVSLAFLAHCGLVDATQYAYPQAHSSQHQYLPAQTYNAYPDLQYPVQQIRDQHFTNMQQEIDVNAVYDPTTAPSYHAYASQDPVQQYSNSYNLDQNGVIDKAALGNQNIPSFSASNGFEPGAFAVQTGYQGYLVPAPGPSSQSSTLFDSEADPLKTITSLLPSFPTAMSAVGRSLTILSRVLGVTLFGGGITTAICTFTPLCAISFALPLVGLRANAKKIAEAIDLDQETSDRITRAADFVQTAIEKFQEMQKTLTRSEVKEVEKVTEKEIKDSKDEKKLESSV